MNGGISSVNEQEKDKRTILREKRLKVEKKIKKGEEKEICGCTKDRIR